MSLRIHRAASFRTLLEHLLDDLQGSSRVDPFAPKWVVTPTSTLAADLRIRLASRAGSSGMTAIRVLPLTRLVRRLIARRSGEAPVARSILLDLLTREMVGRLSPGSALGALNRIDRGFSLLMPIFRDLADAGLETHKTRLIIEGAEPEALSRMARETLEFYATWLETVEALGIPWQPLLHGRLNEWLEESPGEWLDRAMSVEPGQEAEVFVYGFYDFTDLNLGTIVALSNRMRLELLLPGDTADPKEKGSAVFSFVDRALAEIRGRQGAAVVDVAGSTRNPSTRFFLETFPDGTVGQRPTFLSFRRASGVDAEALAAAVQVREWFAREPGLQPQDVLILAPAAGRYLAPLSRVFEEFGLPLSALDIEAEAPLQAGALPLLERVWRDRAPTERVLSYLRDFPEVSERKGVDLDPFEGKLRALRLYGGASWGWLEQRLEVAPESVESVSGAFSEAERRLIEEIFEVWVGHPEATEEMSNSAALAWVDRLSSWLPDPGLPAPSVEGVKEFFRLLPGATLSRDTIFAMLLEDRGDPPRSGSPSHPGVRLISLMRARGLVGRHVILLGLSADQFPRATGDEPLLSDSDRMLVSQAAGALGHRFPVKSQMLEEMALLFFLMNSGCESVHWVIPDCDEHGKAVAPSPWLARYLNAWTDQDLSANAREVAESVPDRVPRSPLQQAEWLMRLDPFAGVYLAPAYGACLHAAFSGLRLGEEFSYFVEALKQREEEEKRNGAIPVAALDKLVSRDRFSVSELETLARCPFRFWASALLGIEGIQPLAWEGELSPLDRGQLVHHCLDWLIRTCGTGGRGFGGILDLLDEAIRERGFLDAEVRGLLMFLPDVFRKSALREIRSLLQGYFLATGARLGKDVLPVRSEVKMRRAFDGLHGRQVSGILDRIDRRGDEIWIVDYKTARSPFKGPPEAFSLLRIGFIAQPILYAWLSEAQGGAESIAGFSFIYLREDPPREIELRVIPDAEAFLDELTAFLEQGIYPLISSKTCEILGLGDAKPCLSCDLASLCRRFDKGAERRGLRLLAERAPARYQTLLSAAGGDRVAE